MQSKVVHLVINASPIASNVSGGGNICPGGAGLNNQFGKQRS
jgi:hypothetical protein